MTFDITMLANANILIIGEVMLDKYIWGDVQQISLEAPVPVVRVKDVSETLGGAGNVAANVVGLGAKTTVMGLIGDDRSGRALEKLFNKRKIETFFAKEHDRPTLTKTRIMAQGYQLLRLDEEHSMSLKSTTEKQLMNTFEAVLPHYHVVILSDQGKGFLETSGLCQAIIQQCIARRIPVLADPKGGCWDRFRGVTGIIPNTAELAKITSSEVCKDDACFVAEAKRLCRGYQLDWLLVTRGPRGMCLVDEKDMTEFIQTTAREVFDVSGADETVLATLAVCLAVGLPIRPAARIANFAAGIVIGKRGTQAIDQVSLADAIRQAETGTPEPSSTIPTDNLSKGL